MAKFDRNDKREDEFKETVVALNRVSKTVKGGRVMKFSALIVVGDGKGTVGYGLGKAAEVPDAIRKGIDAAKKNLIKVTTKGSTIPHEVIGEFGFGHGVALLHTVLCLITQKREPSVLFGPDGSRGFCYQDLDRRTLFSCPPFACIRHHFPRRGRQTETALCASREFHPSEDRSEPPAGGSLIMY